MATQTSSPTTSPSQFEAASLLVFYYVTLGLFLMVCMFVLGNFLSRAILEYRIFKHGSSADRGDFTSGCSGQVLRYSVLVACGLLLFLFVAYWTFWGILLDSLSWHMRIVITKLASSEDVPPEAVKALTEAANRTFVIVVFFVLSVSLNMMVLMRQLVNKSILLRHSNKASVFCLRHADLAELASSPTVTRQLTLSFVLDLVELWTIATWCLYPIFVAVFWVMESSCIGSELALTSASLSPLIGCMFHARYHLLVVCVGWLGVVTGCSLMYFLRYLDERRVLRGIRAGKTPSARWWHVSPFILVTCMLFWAGLAAAILSAIMMGKPLLSAVPIENRVYLAVPGIVLVCGNMLLLFHVGRKLAAVWMVRQLPYVSVFFERGLPLAEGNVPEAAGAVEMENATPYVKLEEYLLY